MVALTFVVVVGLISVVAARTGTDPAYTSVASMVVAGLGALYHQAIVRRLRNEAESDVLTGCLNRRAGMRRLEIEVERAQRYERPFTFISLDIDKFKQINDSRGHPAGDQVLKAFAEVLLTSTRKVDSVVRAGGEEFWVLLPETPLVVGLLYAERLRRRLDRQVIAGGSSIRVTASLGLAEIGKGEPVNQLVSRADKALYAAKAGGRNRVEPAVSTPA